MYRIAVRFGTRQTSATSATPASSGLTASEPTPPAGREVVTFDVAFIRTQEYHRWCQVFSTEEGRDGDRRRAGPTTGISVGEWCDFLAEHPELGVSASERLHIYVVDLVECSRRILEEKGGGR